MVQDRSVLEALVHDFYLLKVAGSQSVNNRNRQFHTHLDYLCNCHPYPR